MASTSKIDKIRDTIVGRLQVVLMELNNSDYPPSITSLDQCFTEINVVHPSLYTDLLKPWRPVGLFLSDNVVADGFDYPNLDEQPQEDRDFMNEWVDQSISDPLTEMLHHNVQQLLLDIRFYLSSEWTAKYKQALDLYTSLRYRTIQPADMLVYMRHAAIHSEGRVYPLLDYFSAWLQPTTLTVTEPLTWLKALPLINEATDTVQLLDVVQRYLLTCLMMNNQARKPIREVPMPVSVEAFGKEIDEYLNDAPKTISTIIYGGKVAYTYAVNLLAQESDSRSNRTHVLSKEITLPIIGITTDQRCHSLCVLTAPLSLSFLYEAAERNYATLVLTTE